MSRRKKGRYFSQRLNSHHISRGLIPRMREYLVGNGDSVVDVEKMAVDLQAQHREYSRKKRAVFQQLVGEVYDNYKTELGVAEQKQSVGDGEGGRQDEERWLIQREQEHLKRNRENADQRDLEHADTAEKELTSSDSGEEVQTPNFNILNNSLIQIYKTDVQNDKGTDTDGLAMSSPPSTAAAASDRVMEMEKENNTPVDLHEPASGDSLLSHDQHVTEIEGETSMHGNSVEPHLETHPDSSNHPSNIASSIDAKPTPKVPTIECADSAPVVGAIEELEVTGKKVSFSTPEVTVQLDYTVGEESRMRPVKRKKSRRHEEESSQAKRKKKEQDTVASPQPKPTKSSEFIVQSSTVRFSDVGGCSECLKEVSKLLLHMKQPELFARLGVRPPQGFLLHGPPGCGKTLIANAIAGELGLPFIKLTATEIVSGVSGESEGTLRELFQLAKDHAPCVLFIDEVDAICRKRETAQREMERRIVTQLLACLDDLNASTCVGHVLVIGATSRPDSLDPALRRAGRFDREISVGIPDLQARLSILKVLCRGLCLEEGFNFSLVAERSPGFVGADLSSLVTEAALCAVNRVLSAHRQRENNHSELTREGGGVCEGSTGEVKGEAVHSFQLEEELPLLTQRQLEATFISTADFLTALECVQPSAKREGFATVPNTTWEDVGALEGIREELSMAILAPVRYPEQFASLGLSSPPGVLLAGPPGCGKTLLAKVNRSGWRSVRCTVCMHAAIANESGINFISVKGPELLNMYVGESERAVRQVFQRARNSLPCVIFFDELDALCPKRSEMAETSASARVVNQLLTEMDGLEARRQVFIMAATNRPDIIDPAVLRPGRLDKILYVGLPSPSDRAAILHTITKGGQRPKLGTDVDLQLLASDQHCKGFSGADLTALVREASIDALKEHMSINPLHLVAVATAAKPATPTQTTPIPSATNIQATQPAKEKECVVCMRHFTNVLKKIHPSVSVKDQAFYTEMAQRFTSSSLTSISPQPL